MKRKLIFLTVLGVLTGLLAIPASSMHWTPGNGNPAAQAQQLGNDNGNGNGVFASDWPPFQNKWPFNQDTMPGNGEGPPTAPDDDENEEADLGICIIGVDSPCNAERWEDPSVGPSPEPGNDSDTTPPEDDDGTGDSGVTEERHVTPAPEPESVGEDWISYPNPRDHMPNPEAAGYDPSIKVCAVMLNQNNEVIRGTTVSDANIAVETDIPYADAQPVMFDLPIDQAQDLIGEDPSLREGDGMLDAECGEYHNLPEGEYSYGAPSITGSDADEIEFVGMTEYWDGTGVGDPFNQRVYSFGENELSDGHIPALEAGNYEQQHAELVYLFRLK